MDWLSNVLRTSSPAQTLLLLAVVACLGFALGSLKVRGIALGVAGVLFVGLILGKILANRGIHVDAAHLELARELGLILFVYTIGLQVGPGFVASLRRDGLPLNILAAGIVLLGMIVAALIHKIVGVDLGIVAGLLSGGTTNTPSLAAAQQAIADTGAAVQPPAIGYAIAYPFGVLGIILAMLLVRAVAKVDIGAERTALHNRLKSTAESMQVANLEVTNQSLVNLPLGDIPGVANSGVVISRFRRGEETTVATGDIRLQLGDVILAVGPRGALADLKLIVGAESSVDLRIAETDVTTQVLVVTRRAVLGRSLAELDLRERYGVTVTRVLRAELQLPPMDIRLQFGDRLTVVGHPAANAIVAKLLGNSASRLNHPQIVAVFFGIALGVLLGSIPFSIPGMPMPVKLGLAGGPLLVAILLSRLGKVGPIVLYMPTSANMILREFGLSMFLAAVGLKAAEGFFAYALTPSGLYWFACGAAITLIPILTAAAVARMWLGLNYVSLCGLLAGSMTDPPALQFATSITKSDGPNVSYATVYPLVTLLRVVGAQVLILLLA